MDSSTIRTGREVRSIADARRNRPKAERLLSVSDLEIFDVVQYGRGRGSRMDLSIGCADRRVRLTGLPAQQVLNYSRIEKSAIEEGMILPYQRNANRVWRKLLSRAMEDARFELCLKSEGIAEAIAAEIRALIEGRHRSGSADGQKPGEVVEQEDELLVIPQAIVRAVQARLADDVLAQATIAEAAAAHLGMRKTRPRFGGHRRHAWKFPLPLAFSEGEEVGGPRLDRGAPSKGGGDVPDEAPAGAFESVGGPDPVRSAGLVSGFGTEG